jgi:type IV pilus assembly protein PilV
MRWRRGAGFTLVEVLVALFVLAVGIAGASATQVLAQRCRHAAALDADGARLAAGLAQRMRANPVAMGAPDSANPYLVGHDASLESAPPMSAPCLGTENCSPLQMAQFDIDDTIEALHARFPGGRLLVCRDTTAWDTAADALSWHCDAAGGAPLMIKLGWRDNGGDAQAVPAPRLAFAVPGGG